MWCSNSAALITFLEMNSAGINTRLHKANAGLAAKTTIVLTIVVAFTLQSLVAVADTADNNGAPSIAGATSGDPGSEAASDAASASTINDVPSTVTTDAAGASSTSNVPSTATTDPARANTTTNNVPTIATSKEEAPDLDGHRYYCADNSQYVLVQYDKLIQTSHISYQDIPIISFPCCIEGLKWMPDEQTVVYLAAAHRTSPIHLYATDLSTKLTRDLTPFSGRSASEFSITGKRNKVLVLLNLQDKLHLDKCLIDTKSGALQLQGWNIKELENYDPASHLVSPSTDSQDLRIATGPASTDAFASPRDQPQFLHWNSHGATALKPPQQLALARSNATDHSSFLAPSPVQPIEGQLKLKDEHPHLIQKSFIFIDPDNPSRKHLSFATPDLKKWTPADKAVITEALSSVAYIAPSVILRAARGHAIYLARADKVLNDVTAPPLSRTGPNYFVASASENTVTFADSFFSSAGHARSVAHELAHVIDIGAHYSLSNEFAQHASPRIDSLRQVIKLNKVEEVSIPVDEYVPRYFGLTCSYAATNLHEALAEMVAEAMYNPTTRKGPVYPLLQKWAFTAPSNADADEELMLKAISLRYEHKNAEAKALLDKLIKDDPAWTMAYDFRSLTLLDLRQPLPALVDNDRVVALLKKNKIGTYNTEFSMVYFHRYRILRQLHRHKEALAAIKVALASSPAPNSEMLWAKVQAYDDLFSGRETIQAVEELLKVFPNQPQNYLLRAFLRIEYLHKRDIQSDLDKADSLQKNRSDGDLMKALCLEKLGKYDQALALYNQVIKDDTNNPCALFHRAQCLQEMHRYALAITDLLAARKIDPYYVPLVREKIAACRSALKAHRHKRGYAH